MSRSSPPPGTPAISDNGPPVQVSMPASDPLVLAVGGTALDAAWASGAYHGEMAWNEGTEASGGGYSSLFPRPSCQDGVARARATRGVPDVAANADSATAMALVFTGGVLQPAVGTSAAARLLSGLPRRHHRRQLRALAHRGLHRLHRRTRLGPGHRLGQPRRPVPRPPAHALWRLTKVRGRRPVHPLPRPRLGHVCPGPRLPGSGQRPGAPKPAPRSHSTSRTSATVPSSSPSPTTASRRAASCCQRSARDGPPSWPA
jgi:hypothetical protein